MSIFRKSVEIIQVWIKLTRITGILHEIMYIYNRYLAEFVLNEKRVTQKL